ncbi:hypothetical protein KZ829_13895 [Actinoplanes hulinensis]|uniref:Uncharacterized protein n=1 Tax=Actinoplanes hulinensis TaxID=1144547 RepID=A0ABS7B1C2_9ACTN|nr:hypothetical protein [Actinoplanes hulinensis]MBW6434831.1 hypothetical protein [Actinoplanes hulinensis]
MATSTKPRQQAQRAGRDNTRIQNVRGSKIIIGDGGLGILGRLAAVATILGTIIALLVAMRPDARHRATPQPSYSTTASPAATPVFARVVNSGSDGIYTYPQPRRGAHYPDGYLDGSLVEVVCQERDGENVRDRDPAPGQPSDWAVWNRLTTGRWIPDMWTDLPKVPGSAPPHGLPRC